MLQVIQFINMLDKMSHLSMHTTIMFDRSVWANQMYVLIYVLCLHAKQTVCLMWNLPLRLVQFKQYSIQL